MYVIVGIAVVGIIALVAILSVSSITSMSLDQILKNKDCEALEKWGNEYLYDENLNLTNEQQKKIMSVGFECGMKAAKNIFSDSSKIITPPQPEKVKPVDKITLDKFQYRSGEVVNVEVSVADPTIKDVSIILQKWDGKYSQKENVSIDRFGNGSVDFVIPEIYPSMGKNILFDVKMYVTDNSRMIFEELRVYPREMPSNIFSEIDSLHSELNDKVSQLFVTETLVPWITDVTIQPPAHRNDVVKVAVWLSYQVSEDVVVNFMNTEKEVIQETLLTTKEFGVGSVDFIMPEIVCRTYLTWCPMYIQVHLKDYPEHLVTESFTYYMASDTQRWGEDTDDYNKRMDKLENGTSDVPW